MKLPGAWEPLLRALGRADLAAATACFTPDAVLEALAPTEATARGAAEIGALLGRGLALGRFRPGGVRDVGGAADGAVWCLTYAVLEPAARDLPGFGPAGARVPLVIEADLWESAGRLARARVWIGPG